MLLVGLLHQPVVNCVERQFEPVCDGEPLKDSIHVIPYGHLADAKSFGDLAVATALHYQLHNLFFADARWWFFSLRPPPWKS